MGYQIRTQANMSCIYSFIITPFRILQSNKIFLFEIITKILNRKHHSFLTTNLRFMIKIVLIHNYVVNHSI